MTGITVKVQFEADKLLSVYAQWLKLIPWLISEIEKVDYEDAVVHVEYDAINVHYRGEAFRIYREQGDVFFQDVAQKRLSEMLPEEDAGYESGFPIDGWQSDPRRVEDFAHLVSWMLPEAFKAADLWWSAHWAADGLTDLGKSAGA